MLHKIHIGLRTRIANSLAVHLANPDDIGKKKYFPALDGVRALAALMVMVGHFDSYWKKDSSQRLIMLAPAAVSLFFVLSGFLITGILLESKNKERYFLNFYMRRTLRIFPLYFLFLAIYYFVLPVILNEPIIGRQWAYWLFLTDFAQTFEWNAQGPLHYWSLAVEEHFYLFWPLIIYFLPKRGLVTAIMIILLLSFVVRYSLTVHGYPNYLFTFGRMDELALGSLLAVHKINRPDKRVIRRATIVLISVSVLIAIFWALFSGQANPIAQSLRYTLIAIFFACLMAMVLSSGNNPISRILQTRALRYTGEISYGLYVYHSSIFLIVQRCFNLNNNLIYFVISITLCYGVASLSYFLFERPFLRLKKRFKD